MIRSRPASEPRPLGRVWAAPWAVLAVTAATLVAAFATKARCLGVSSGYLPSTCYNDIQYLWGQRMMAEHVLPYQGSFERLYQHGELVGIRLGAGQLEYPVLSGLFAWLTGLPVSTSPAYLAVNMLALAPFALLTSWLLYRLVGVRAYIFAAGPALIAYAYLNWDLLPVTAAVAGVWCWRKGRVGWAGVLFAIGACFKVWPGFFLVPLVVMLLTGRRFRDCLRLVGAAVATVLATNLPFLVANPSGWVAPYLMQSLRLNEYNTNSVWHWLVPDWPLHRVATWSNTLVLLAWIVLLAAGYLRARRAARPAGAEERQEAPPGAEPYPWLQVGAAMLTAYVILGRVDSPQYGLWLLPFVALVAVPRFWVAAYVVADIFLYLQWSWLWGAPAWMMPVAVTLRVAVFGALCVVFVLSPIRWADREPEPDAPDAATPPAGARPEDRGRAPTPEPLR